MVSIMDATEAQRRYGSALSSAGDPGHPSHPLHASQHSARRERMTAREEATLRTLEGRRYDSAPSLPSLWRDGDGCFPKLSNDHQSLNHMVGAQPPSQALAF